MEVLVEMFKVLVIEGYGMTEVVYQMALNLLGAGKQKPGLVGIEVGLLVCVVYEIENWLVIGVGEIVISGFNVIFGYEGNLEVNEKNFFEVENWCWFCIGD